MQRSRLQLAHGKISSPVPMASAYRMQGSVMDSLTVVTNQMNHSVVVATAKTMNGNAGKFLDLTLSLCIIPVK